MISDAWARINVDETDAQRRRRIETELSTLFQADAIAVAPAKREPPVTAESSWRRLFGVSARRPTDEAAVAAAANTNENAGAEETIYFARPTIADVISFGTNGSKGGSIVPPTASTGDGQRAMPRSEDAIRYLSASASAAAVPPSAEGGASRAGAMASKVAFARTLSSESAANSRGGTNWRDLPPCPLNGHVLTDKGLVNLAAFAEEQQRKVAEEEAKRKASSRWFGFGFGGAGASSAASASPSQDPNEASMRTVVPAEDLLTLCDNATKFRTATKMMSEDRQNSRQHDTATIGLAKVMPYMVGGAAAAMLYNVARCFSSTPARSSLMFEYWWTRQRGFSEAELQRFAQRFRTPLVLTTRAMSSQLAVAGTFLFIAYYFRTPQDVASLTAEATRTRLVDDQEAKAHALARYLWFVYYNHPVYAEHSAVRASSVRL